LYQDKLRSFLIEKPNLNIGNLSHTLQLHKDNLLYRRYTIASNKEMLISSLENQSKSKAKLARTVKTLAFVFPGQGAQYINMGKEIYECEPVFREEIDRCAEILNDIIDKDIRRILFPASVDYNAEDNLTNTLYTQLTLFVVEYALAKLWESWG